MTAACRRCGAELEVQADLLLARCRACRTVTDLTPPRGRPEVPLPARFRVEREAGTLRIEWRWFSARTIGLLLASVVFDGTLVVQLLLLSGPPLVFFGLVHAVVSFGLSWAALCGLFNRTRIEVEPGFLRVRHGPLPWPGNREVPVSRIRQLYCTEVDESDSDGTSFSYSLLATPGPGAGKPLVLIKRLPKPEQALFLEQAVEQLLGIADRPVEGEIPK
jgi:hypothetical protein